MEYPVGGPYRTMMSRRDLMSAGLAFAATYAGFATGKAQALTALAESAQAVPGWNSDLQKFGAALMDTILPEDDGYGALTVGAPQFLELVLRDVLKPERRLALVEGLRALQTSLTQQLGTSFESLAPTRRHNELARFDSSTYVALADGAVAAPAQLAYVHLKEITLVAFFTNEAVAKRLLDYAPVPGHYEADLPVTDDLRTFYEDDMAGSQHRFAGKLI